VAYLDAVINHLGGEPSGLVELDLSCIKREETSRIGDAAVSKIVVRKREIGAFYCIYCRICKNFLLNFLPLVFRIAVLS
jgi:hypothetical protein